MLFVSIRKVQLIIFSKENQNLSAFDKLRFRHGNNCISVEDELVVQCLKNGCPVEPSNSQAKPLPKNPARNCVHSNYIFYGSAHYGAH